MNTMCQIIAGIKKEIRCASYIKKALLCTGERHVKLPLLVISGCHHLEWHQILLRAKLHNCPLLIKKEMPNHCSWNYFSGQWTRRTKHIFWMIWELCWPFYILPSILLYLSLCFSRPLKIHPCEPHWLGFFVLSVESSRDTSKWRKSEVRVVFFGPLSIIQPKLSISSLCNSSLLHVKSRPPCLPLALESWWLCPSLSGHLPHS